MAEQKQQVPEGFCDSCWCNPCHCEELAEARKNGATHCIACETELGLRGGMSGTDLCGPCCTGEAETLNEYGETW